MDLWVCEVCLFKYGFGIGFNFFYVCLEGEKFFGGGKFFGLMSFLKIGDWVVGVIKFGGIICCVVKMVVVDVDYFDIEEYINWKVKEEQKVVVFVIGFKICQKYFIVIMCVCVNCEVDNGDCFDLVKNLVLKCEICVVKKMMVLENYIQCVIQFVCQGFIKIEFWIFNIDWDFEVYFIVVGQNFNNLVWVIDGFFNVVVDDSEWDLIGWCMGEVLKIVKVKDLWEQIGYVVWVFVDLGL